MTAVIDFLFYVKGNTRQLQCSHTARKSHSAFTSKDKHVLRLNNRGRPLDTRDTEEQLRSLRGGKSVSWKLEALFTLNFKMSIKSQINANSHRYVLQLLEPFEEVVRDAFDLIRFVVLQETCHDFLN